MTNPMTTQKTWWLIPAVLLMGIAIGGTCSVVFVYGMEVLYQIWSK